MADAIVRVKTCRKCGAEFSGKYCKNCKRIYGQLRAASTEVRACVRCGSTFTGKSCRPCQNASSAKSRQRERPCSRCGVVMVSGHAYCKACAHERAVARYALNREAEKAKAKSYRTANTEKIRVARAARYEANREKILTWSAERYRRNTVRAKALAKAWVERNPERRKENMRAWCRANVKRLLVNAQNRRNRKRLNGGKLSPGIVGKLYSLQRGKCACCGKPLGNDYHLDHIVPISRGGENIDSNVQLLTATCNLEKNAKDPIEFMQERGFLI